MHKKLLLDFYHEGLTAVHGHAAVVHAAKKYLSTNNSYAVVAIGKAAASMMSGAHHVLGTRMHSGLLITKYGHGCEHPDWNCIESGHPVPDQQSLNAGDSLLKFLANLPVDVPLLVLVSGGASSLVEVLPDAMELTDLQRLNNWLLASGLDIHQVNQVRRACSQIKGGRLCQHLQDRKVTQLLISDVPGDRIEMIGSGLLCPDATSPEAVKLPGWIKDFIQPGHQQQTDNIQSHIVASNSYLCEEIAAKASQQGCPVTLHHNALQGDVNTMANMLAQYLANCSTGIHIWGGETTVKLPESPGRGGRNQSLALALACKIQGWKDITVLVAATDGSDGPTSDAGAIIDGDTLSEAGLELEATIDNEQANWERQHAEYCLAMADAGSFLQSAGALISTGPTGTNVMDIVIALVDRNNEQK